MLREDLDFNNKSIMLSVLGAPNVGKSTLVNELLGMDLTIVTSKEQTTRNKFHCIFCVDKTEIILVDTPGIHRSNKEINKRMNEQAKEGARGVDINLLLIDLTKEMMPQFENIQKHLEGELHRSWVIFTKSDMVSKMEDYPFDGIVAKAKEVIPSIEKHFVISAKTGTRVHELMGAICDAAPFSPHLYTNGEVSNRNERFFVSEYVRQQAFELLKDELPHEIAVMVDEFMEGVSNKVMGQRFCQISATILVNRPSQRAIVIGSKGNMIKEIGTRARKKIEQMTGGQVHLNLHVKVSPRWFKNNFVLEELGLPRAIESARVWRAQS